MTARICGTIRAASMAASRSELELMGESLDEVRATAARALALFAQAAVAGYDRAYLWDDTGRFYGRLQIGTGIDGRKSGRGSRHGCPRPGAVRPGGSGRL